MHALSPRKKSDCFDKNKVTLIILFKYLSMFGKGLFLWNCEYFAGKYFYLNAHNKKFQGYTFHREACCFPKQPKKLKREEFGPTLGYRFINAELLK